MGQLSGPAWSDWSDWSGQLGRIGRATQRCIHTKFVGPIYLLTILERAPLKPKHILFNLITVHAIFMLFI